MTTTAQLHLLSQTTTEEQLSARLTLVGKDDGIVFMQDSCYSLKSPAVVALLAYQTFKLYALADDMQARNIDAPSVELIDYPQFVQLSLDYQKTISW